jgi:protein AroM
MGSDPLSIGLLTVGQSPRDDVRPTLRAILGESVHLRESGALDGLTRAGLDELGPAPGETPLETRAAGGGIMVSEERLLRLLRAAASRLEDSCDLTLLLCSGEFPELAESHPRVIQPVHLLRGTVRALCRGRVLGIVGPQSDVADAPERWGAYATRVVASAASPYGAAAAVGAAARKVVDQGGELVFLNDMAFTGRHRSHAAAAGAPVLCATTLVAQAVRDLL